MDYGYSPSNKIVDPDYILLISNLMAEVQLYATHGSIDSIRFKGSASGIKTGDSIIELGDREMIGITDIKKYWLPNTKLVTYIACDTGGKNGISDKNSLVYQTVSAGGVDVCVGFKKEIYYDSAKEWSRNYNMYLASGYGVKDAVEYANSKKYPNNNVHSTYVVYSSDPNMKIGKYASTYSNFSELDTIEKSYLMKDLKTRNILENKINLISKDEIEIRKVLEKVIPNFKEDNYIINKEDCDITDVNTNETKKIEYIDVRLKIGDFYTNAGYDIKIENNVITAIYDNNIDIEKQENAIKRKNEFFINANINKIKENIIDERIKNTENTIISENESYKYFYDIEKDKKYVEFKVKNVISDFDKGEDVAVDNIRVEI